MVQEHTQRLHSIPGKCILSAILSYPQFIKGLFNWLLFTAAGVFSAVSQGNPVSGYVSHIPFWCFCKILIWDRRNVSVKYQHIRCYLQVSFMACDIPQQGFRNGYQVTAFFILFSQAPDMAGHARTRRQQASVHCYSWLPLGQSEWWVDSFHFFKIQLNLEHGQ